MTVTELLLCSLYVRVKFNPAAPKIRKKIPYCVQKPLKCYLRHPKILKILPMAANIFRPSEKGAAHRDP